MREVRDFLAAQMFEAMDAGIAQDHIVLDPGIGFGKTLEHNLLLLRGLPALAALGQPLLVGVSRKAFIGKILGSRPAGPFRRQPRRRGRSDVWRAPTSSASMT